MSAAAETTFMPPAEMVAVFPNREKVLYLRKQPLSKAQVKDARSILNDAIDELLSIDAIGAADLLTDLKAALGGAA